KSLIEHICKEAAIGLKVDRVSLWNHNTDHIVLYNIFVKNENKHYNDLTLFKKDFPKYFEAIAKDSVIVASDANKHPALHEFVSPYFEEYNIKSLLDVPLYVSGKLVGITCFEATNEI